MSNQHVGESSAITGTAVTMKSTTLCSNAVKLHILAVVVSVQVTQQVGQTHNHM